MEDPGLAWWRQGLQSGWTLEGQSSWGAGYNNRQSERLVRLLWVNLTEQQQGKKS
jgi:hypothetical protein